MTPFSSDFQSDMKLSQLSAPCLAKSGIDPDDFDKLMLFRG